MNEEEEKTENEKEFESQRVEIDRSKVTPFPSEVYSPFIISACPTDAALLEVASHAPASTKRNNHDDDDKGADEDDANHANDHIRNPVNERIAVERKKERRKNE